MEISRGQLHQTLKGSGSAERKWAFQVSVHGNGTDFDYSGACSGGLP